MAGQVPVCANLFPSGEYLMEDFYFAGGLLALLTKLGRHLDLDALTVNGTHARREHRRRGMLERRRHPRRGQSRRCRLSRGKTLAVLRGNLAPNGAVMKSSRPHPKFLKHVGPAIVFDSPAEMNRTIDDPDLDITEDSVLVLRNAGPVGAPGMPEWGNLPIPKKLLKQGVRDMVRICDGRMSGTHYGTCILHVAPEAAVGGPLALAAHRRPGRARRRGRAPRHAGERGGDRAPPRRMDADRAASTTRSFAALYQRHVSQADEGCDFDFLSAPGTVAEPAIY